ncbi:phosphatase PAP2 family protein [Amycolatopsis sp. QT-25]|uniref:phosphatase PAP2 family protein n=1 Tax=Amycolatopsis sp. QT-25 TaxID=3034022 RepID=UPI0023ED825F|nr:phosphatase PAP2 family protein [Amycolatopsis sp. QT-25]WET79030.1 phosphatase PAP2 family protein [Amycolatopsis sp. QT-25]
MVTRLQLAAGSGDGLYDSIIEFAAYSPAWLQGLGSMFTKVGLLFFGALFVAVWWRARATNDTTQVTRALLAPVVTVIAYVLSELLKLVVNEDRPCRGLPEGSTILECPEVGDWSLPSNHATIAAAAAMGLILARRRVAPLVMALTLLMAFSRVFVGVHYPHDVLLGIALGIGVAWPTATLLVSPAHSIVARLAGVPALGILLFARVPQGGVPAQRPDRATPAGPADAAPQRPVGRPLGGGAAPTERMPQVPLSERQTVHMRQQRLPQQAPGQRPSRNQEQAGRPPAREPRRDGSSRAAHSRPAS